MKRVSLIVMLICISVLSLSEIKTFGEDAKYPFFNPALSVEERVADLLPRLTLEEKISFLYELSPGVERLGIAQYFHGNEALHGVVRPGKFTVFPQAISLASMWDPEFIFTISSAISDEARAKFNYLGPEFPMNHSGLLTFWSPTVNMARDPRWGRTAETYGEDPFLSGRIGVQFVKGLQGNDPKYLKVVSTPKHYAGNNEEHNRFGCKPDIDMYNLRNYYLPAFKALITEGGAYSIMGAYNAVFGVPCNQSHFLLTDVLRNEWGFKGYVVTDCGGIEWAVNKHKYAKTMEEAAANAITAGVDLECGGV